MSEEEDADARRLSAQALALGEATGWFESLYAEAEQGSAIVPWDRGSPNAMLVAWADQVELRGAGRRALVVGCGYGRDSEYLASLGFQVTAFDVSPSAIAGARKRHRGSLVSYQTADLFDLPAEWAGAFEFVLESHDVQALPDPPRATAIAAVRSMVAPGGTLLVFAAGRADDSPDPDGPPWPLLRREIESFAGDGLMTDEVHAQTDDGVMRWRARFHRAPG